MLSIGALYGRLLGECLVLWFGEYYYYGDKYDDANAYHSWMDPGAIALIGAASFFAGVSRLTISLTVIMIEITNDVTMLLPVMTGMGSLDPAYVIESAPKLTPCYVRLSA